MAESAGFEPAELLHPLRFERSTLNHSDNFPSLEMVRWVGVEPTSEESQSSILAVELPKGFGGSDDWIRTNGHFRMKEL